MSGLREALEETYDELDGGIDTASTEHVEASAELQQVDVPAGEPEAPELSGADVRPRDESGKFVAKPASQEQPAAAPAQTPARGGAQATGSLASPQATPVAAPALPKLRPPQDWKTGAREHWEQLPRQVQEEAIRLHIEAKKALQLRAEAERSTQAFQGVLRPYEAQIRASGVQPQQYLGNLLQTAHALSYGAPQQKADTLAAIVMQFGVTPQDLDAALVARMQGQPQRQAPQPQQFRDPRLDQFFAAQQQQAVSEADETANGFADTHEFFNDVADHVADLLDVWAKQGKTSVTEADMERAYQIACNLNEDVRTTIEQRKAASAVQTAQAATERARTAASSVRSQPTAGVPAQRTGRRTVLEDKWDELDSQ